MQETFLWQRPFRQLFDKVVLNVRFPHGSIRLYEYTGEGMGVARSCSDPIGENVPNRRYYVTLV